MQRHLLGALAAFMLTAAVQDRGRTLAELIDAWKAPDFAARDQAYEELLTRWSTWSSKDLESLRTAAREKDDEVASRAKSALERLGFRGAFWSRFPEDRRVEWEKSLLAASTEAQAVALRSIAGWCRDDDARRVLAAEIARYVCARGSGPQAKEALELARGFRPYSALLVPLLKSTSPDIRAEAVVGLQQNLSFEFTDDIAPLLSDPAEYVRLSALTAIGCCLGGPTHRKFALHGLQDKSSFVRSIALRALARIGKKEDAKGIHPFLNDDSSSVQLLAFEALGVLGGIEDISVIAPYLSNEKEIVRISALEALTVIGHVKAAPLLQTRVADPNGTVRFVALSGLGRIAADSADLELRKMIVATLHSSAEDADWGTRTAAKSALFRLEKRNAADARALLREIADLGEKGVGAGEEMFDALFACFFPDTYRGIRSEVSVTSDVTTVEGLRQLLDGTGLKLMKPATPSLDAITRAGMRAQVRQILNCMVKPKDTYLIPTGEGGVAFESYDDAMKIWLERFGNRK